MIKTILEWILSFFIPKEQKKLETNIKEKKAKLKEIQDEKTDINSVLDRFND